MPAEAHAPAAPLAEAQTLAAALKPGSRTLGRLLECCLKLSSQDAGKLGDFGALHAVVLKDVQGRDLEQILLAMNFMGWMMHIMPEVLSSEQILATLTSIKDVFDSQECRENAEKGKRKALMCVWAYSQYKGPVDATIVDMLVDVAHNAVFRQSFGSLTMFHSAAELMRAISRFSDVRSLIKRPSREFGTALIHLIVLDGSGKLATKPDQVAKLVKIRHTATEALNYTLDVFWNEEPNNVVWRQIQANQTWDAEIAPLCRRVSEAEDCRLALAECSGLLTCLLGPYLDQISLTSQEPRINVLLGACQILFQTPATCQAMARSWRLIVENVLGMRRKPIVGDLRRMALSTLISPIHDMLASGSLGAGSTVYGTKDRNAALDTLSYICLFDHPDTKGLDPDADLGTEVATPSPVHCLLLALNELNEGNRETAQRAAQFAATLVSGVPQLPPKFPDLRAWAKQLAMEHALGVKGLVPCIFHHTQHAREILLTTSHARVWEAALRNASLAPLARSLLPLHPRLGLIAEALSGILAPGDALAGFTATTSPAVAGHLAKMAGGISRVVLECDWRAFSTLVPAPELAEAFALVCSQSGALTLEARKRCIELAFTYARALDTKSPMDWLETSLYQVAKPLESNDRATFSKLLLGLIQSTSMDKLALPVLLHTLPSMLGLMDIDAEVGSLVGLFNRLLLVIDCDADPYLVWASVKALFRMPEKKLLAVLGNEKLALPVHELDASKHAFWSLALPSVYAIFSAERYPHGSDIVELQRLLVMALGQKDLHEEASRFWGNRVAPSMLAPLLKAPPAKRSLSMMAASSGQSQDSSSDGLTERQRQVKRADVVTYTHLDPSQTTASFPMPVAPHQPRSNTGVVDTEPDVVMGTPLNPTSSLLESRHQGQYNVSSLVTLVQRWQAEFAPFRNEALALRDMEAAAMAYDFAMDLLRACRPAASRG